MPLFVLALLLLAASPASSAPCTRQAMSQSFTGCERRDGQAGCSAQMFNYLVACDAEAEQIRESLKSAGAAEAPALRERARVLNEAWDYMKQNEVERADAEARAKGRQAPNLLRDLAAARSRYEDINTRMEAFNRRFPPGLDPSGENGLRPEAPLPPPGPQRVAAQRDAERTGDRVTLGLIAQQLAAEGADEEARKVLDVIGGMGGLTVEANLADSALQLKAGRREEALAAADRALALDPSNKRAREIRSFILGRSGEMKAAGKLPDFGGAGADGAFGAPGAGGERARGSSGMGGGFAAGGGFAGSGGAGFARDPGGAGAARRSPAEQATAVPSSPYQQLLATARRKLGMGDLTGALFDCTRAIQADPGDADGWKLRAHVNNRLGQHDAALRDAEEALKLAPGDVAARLERVYALIGLGRFAEALAEADSVLKEAPGNALAHLYRGMALIKLGRVPEGEAALDEAVRLDPSLRALADPLRSKKAAPAPARRVDPRKGLYVLCGLMALLLLLEGSKRVFKPGWRTTGPRPETEAPVPTGTLPPGTMLGGNYRVEKELARGGMGVVYRAQDVTLRRPVAIKQMRTGVPEIERFLREARLAAKLRHQNLAQIFSVIDAGRQPFLVFEFVEGEALDALLKRRGPLTLEETVALLSPLAAALDYAHAQKVIHRDLKPANVMLSVDGVPKLMDFGIAHEARSAQGETRTEAWGTPPYMAPEQESGVVSRQSDLYALAVMAYELLTGKLPFQGMMDKINRSFVRPPDPRLAAAFEKAFDPLPAGRPESAAAFLASLRACLPAR